MRSGMMMVMVMTTLTVLGGCSSQQEREAEASTHGATVALEFRLAEMAPAEGLTEVSISDLNLKFYLHDEVVLDNSDVASAAVIEQPVGHGVEIVLTESGKQKFARLTEQNVKKLLGMVVDSELVCAPLINAPIAVGKAIIEGRFSPEEAERIAAGIVPEPTVEETE
jgi:preprotein translocase subunit SecD